MKKKLFPVLFIFFLLGFLPLTSSSQSVVTIESGASITITGGGSSGDAYFCSDSFYVATGGSLTAWSPAAICNAPIGGDGTVSQGFIEANIKVFLEGAYK